jgi:cell division protein FtsW
MTAFARTDRGLIATWWWTVDRLLLTALLVLALIGIVLVFAASPPVAQRLGLPELHFVGRHVVLLVPALALMVAASLLNARGVLRLGVGLLALGVALMLATLVLGTPVKGARRWLTLGTLTLQPSELVKPGLAVACAWLLASRPGLQGAALACLLVGAVALILQQQPDIGMAAIVVLVLAVQLFLGGLPWLLVLAVAGLGTLGAWQMYRMFPHVAGRIDSFLDPDSVGFQVAQARRAVMAGGWTGRGPGEGIAKYHLPDAHADFILAAAAEEFGLLVTLGLVLLLAFVVLRGLWRAFHTPGRFALLAAAGLLAQFGLQALINIGVNLDLLPTKGMTLPFISYGGSSLLALGLGMGMVLALTRRRGPGEVMP